jgi:hypothetical protein
MTQPKRKKNLEGEAVKLIQELIPNELVKLL